MALREQEARERMMGLASRAGQAATQERKRIYQQQLNDRKREEEAKKAGMWSKVGTTLGTLGGAAVGSMITPGIGTAIGASLGGTLGGAIGGGAAGDWGAGLSHGMDVGMPMGMQAISMHNADKMRQEDLLKEGTSAADYDEDMSLIPKLAPVPDTQMGAGGPVLAAPIQLRAANAMARQKMLGQIDRMTAGASMGSRTPIDTTGVKRYP